MTHAKRAHECGGCGRIVYGNGGKASHERACPDYRIVRLAHLERMVEYYDANPNLSYRRPGTVAELERLYASTKAGTPDA